MVRRKSSRMRPRRPVEVPFPKDRVEWCDPGGLLAHGLSTCMPRGHPSARPAVRRPCRGRRALPTGHGCLSSPGRPPQCCSGRCVAYWMWERRRFPCGMMRTLASRSGTPAAACGTSGLSRRAARSQSGGRQPARTSQRLGRLVLLGQREPADDRQDDGDHGVSCAQVREVIMTQWARFRVSAEDGRLQPLQ